MTPLIIIGAGGHGSEVACYVRESEKPIGLYLLGFIDDARDQGSFAGSSVLGSLSLLPELAKKYPTGLRYITALGSNSVRKIVVDKVSALELAVLLPNSVISSSSWIGQDVDIASGTCIAPGSVLTTGIRIGRHCIINVKASISHDCEIGDFVNINPGATLCGNVIVGEGSFIGAGAVVKEKIRIGVNTIIGAGSVVIHDVPDNVTVVGVPARIIRQA